MTQPIGPQYGLNPRFDHVPTRPPVESVDILSNPIVYDDFTAGEFSGVGGLVQPFPHTANATERLNQIYAIDPTDPGTELGSVAAPELEGLFNSGTE